MPRRRRHDHMSAHAAHESSFVTVSFPHRAVGVARVPQRNPALRRHQGPARRLPLQRHADRLRGHARGHQQRPQHRRRAQSLCPGGRRDHHDGADSAYVEATSMQRIASMAPESVVVPPFATRLVIVCVNAGLQAGLHAEAAAAYQTQYFCMVPGARDGELAFDLVF